MIRSSYRGLIHRSREETVLVEPEFPPPNVFLGTPRGTVLLPTGDRVRTILGTHDALLAGFRSFIKLTEG